MSQKHVYEAIATLTGAVIGAGVIGIPYVMAKAGFLTGLLVLVGLGLVFLIVNLCVGEITLRTKGTHQLTGYVGFYLGSWGRRLMLVAMVFNTYSALMAYIIGEGKSLAELFGGNPWLWSTAFFLIGSVIIYRGLAAAGISELILCVIKFAAFLIAIIMMVFSQFFDMANLAGFDIHSLFIPYGVIMFAFMGFIAIPEMRQELSHHLKDFRKSIVIGSLIPLAVYVLFGLAVVGVTGAYTTEVANVAIGRTLGFIPLVLVNLFAILSMATSFIPIGFGLKEMYQYDYRFRPLSAFLLTLLPPVLIIFAGLKSFIFILELSGALAGGIFGVLLLLTYWKARKHGERKPEYEMNIHYVFIVLMILVFAIGAIITIKEAII